MGAVQLLPQQGETVMFARIVAAAAMLMVATPVWAEDEEQAIRDLEQKFAEAFKAKDIDAILALYDPNVLVFDVVPPRQFLGTAAYRKDWEGFFSAIDGPVRFDINHLTVTADGNLAYGTSIQDVSGTDKTGQNFHMAVRVTDVYRKSNNGEWLIVHEHVSVPVNLETNMPDMMSRE